MPSRLATWLVVNFLFDYVLLWATGRVRGESVPALRLALGAWIGAALFTLASLGSPALRLVVCAVGGPWLMAAAAFRIRGLRRLCAVVAVMCGVGFVAAGAGMAAQSVLAGQGRAELGALVSLAVLVGTAVAARRYLSNALVTRALQAHVRMRFGERWIYAEGMLDTGNHLTEPVERLAVVLVDPRVLAPVVEAALGERLEELARDPFALASRLTALAPEWARRFRLVPFQAVGTERGVMAAFRADSVEVHLNGVPPPAMGPAVVALSPTPLRAGELQALVPADYVARPGRTSPAGQSPWAVGGGVVGVKAG